MLGHARAGYEPAMILNSKIGVSALASLTYQLSSNSCTIEVETQT